jgi:hypothetical protein
VARLFLFAGQFSKDVGRNKKIAVFSHFKPKRPRFKMIDYKIMSINTIKFFYKGHKKSLAGCMWHAGLSLSMSAILRKPRVLGRVKPDWTIWVGLSQFCLSTATSPNATHVNRGYN